MPDTLSPLMLFSGNANRVLAQDIANYLKVPMGKPRSAPSRMARPRSKSWKRSRQGRLPGAAHLRAD